MCSFGNFILLFGGGNSSTWLNDLYILDTGIFNIHLFLLFLLETFVWALAPPNRPPSGRCAHALCSFNKKVLLYGGYDGTKSRLKDCYLFDIGISLPFYF